MFDVIEQQPRRLQEVDGIGLKRSETAKAEPDQLLGGLMGQRRTPMQTLDQAIEAKTFILVERPGNAEPEIITAAIGLSSNTLRRAEVS